MNAFGKRNGLGGGAAQRGSFGVARPMKGSAGGGDQFPPVEEVEEAPAAPSSPQPNAPPRGAMDRLNQRQNGSGEAGNSKVEGFEASVHRIKEQVLPRLLERVDPEAAATLGKDELAEEFRPIISEVLGELKINLNRREQFALEKVLVDELLGLGPLEELLSDPSISDIMVNGPDQTYVERKGKLELAQIQFRDEEHLFQIAQRIVNKVGRRVDQTTPLADARLPDGSRVNVIVPPLSLRGTAISIRKFSEKPITLDMMRGFGSMSEKMATLLKIAGAARMNIVISGGTGSGKTTMLNALSKMIDPGERVLTIEDAAELRLQQPHWLPLETRPPNLEGNGAITIRDLVINALRMRPDRIILGEIRGPECFDLLAAMNTGHDGSMATLHSNSPARMPRAYGKHGHDVGHQGAEGSDLAPDRQLGRPHRPGQAPPRRLAPHHQHHRSDRDGRRRHRHPGTVQVPISRRKRRRQDHRRISIDGPAPLYAGESQAIWLRPAVFRGLPLSRQAWMLMAHRSWC